MRTRSLSPSVGQISLHFFLGVLPALFLFFVATQGEVFAQGLAVVNPLSAFAKPDTKQLAFSVLSRSAEDTKFSVVHECVIDGKEAKGKECRDAFEVEFDSLQPDGTFELKAGSSVAVKLSAPPVAKSFAMYKPLISPIFQKKTGEKKGIAFDFDYRPGMLFIVNPEKPNYADFSLETFLIGKEKRVKVTLPIDFLKSPQVVNMSGKIMEKSTKKMLRLVPLARQKILDPLRKVLVVDGAYALASDTL